MIEVNKSIDIDLEAQYVRRLKFENINQKIQIHLLTSKYKTEKTFNKFYLFLFVLIILINIIEKISK